MSEMTQVLLVSDGLVHPSALGRFLLRKAFEKMQGYSFQRAATLEKLPGLAASGFRALVLHYHHDSISGAALDSLEGFVANGGGVLVVHSASASFKGEKRYFDILGGRFVEHGPIETFSVQPVAPHDEVFGDIPAFSVKDELYRHEYHTGNRIHFYTMVDGEREPVVWTRDFGARVCYCALGHTLSSIRHPALQKLQRRGLAWVCGNPNPEGFDKL